MSELVSKLYAITLGILTSLSFVFSSISEKISFLHDTTTQTIQEIPRTANNPKELLKQDSKDKALETLTNDSIVIDTTKKKSSADIAKTETNTSKEPLSYTEKIVPNTSSIAMDTYDTDSSTSVTAFKKPCSQIIGYKLGTFDPQFEISQSEFLRILSEASSLWSNAHGSTLFVYDREGPLTINLIYDGRQARTKENKLLALEIANTKEAAEKLEELYEKDKATYTLQAKQHTDEVELYNAKFKSYDTRVIEYNNRGGATKEEFDAMMREKEDLSKEAMKLDENRKNLLAFVDTINVKIKRHNELVAYVNSLIAENNTFGAKKFTEGMYNQATKSITIYQYTDFIKLKRVLAHEFGHVLSLGHTKDKNSIMHYINTGTTTNLTKDDIVALTASCSQ